MSGSVNAQLKHGVIYVEWQGTVDERVLEEGQRQIRELLATRRSGRILHDTLAMDDPSTALALKMRSFDMQIKDEVSGIATVVKSAKAAVMAKISFTFSPKHEVFRNDPGAALEWLNRLS